MVPLVEVSRLDKNNLKLKRANFCSKKIHLSYSWGWSAPLVVTDAKCLEILQILCTYLQILFQTFLHNLSHYFGVIDVWSMFSEKACET